MKSNKMDVQVFYNKRWSDFSYINKTKLQRSIKILDAISDIHIAEPRILDLGCGSGWLTSMLGLIGPTTGLDLSDDAVNDASSRYPHVSFVQADFVNENITSLFKEKFDIVVSQEVIEHIEDQKKFLDLVAELIKPSGYLVLTTPNKFACNLQPLDVISAYERQPVENWLTTFELKNILKPYFKVLHCETFIHNSMFNQTFTNFYLRIRKLFRQLYLGSLFDQIVFTLGLGLHIFVVATKKPDYG